MTTTQVQTKAQQDRACSGFTLVEVMVSVGILSLVLMARIGAFFVFARGSLSVAAYSEMSQQSRRALEQFSRDVRSATTLSASDLKTKTDGSGTVYTNDSIVTDSIADGERTRTQDGSAFITAIIFTAAVAITVKGNGDVTSLVYAPNSAVTINGGGTDRDSTGEFKGAVVGYSTTFTGDVVFWYDRALGDENLGGNRYDVKSWTDVTLMSEVASGREDDFRAIGRVDMTNLFN